MARKEEQRLDEPAKEIAEKIDQACKEVVLVEEIEKLKEQSMQQLSQAKDNFATAKQQLALWDTRIKQVTGSLATCNTLLEKRQKTKSLILQDDHNKKGKE